MTLRRVLRMPPALPEAPSPVYSGALKCTEKREQAGGHGEEASASARKSDIRIAWCCSRGAGRFKVEPDVIQTANREDGGRAANHSAGRIRNQRPTRGAMHDSSDQPHQERPVRAVRVMRVTVW